MNALLLGAFCTAAGASATATWILPLALQAYTVADVLVIPSIITTSLVMSTTLSVQATSLVYIALGASLLLLLGWWWLVQQAASHCIAGALDTHTRTVCWLVLYSVLCAGVPTAWYTVAKLEAALALAHTACSTCCPLPLPVDAPAAWWRHHYLLGNAYVWLIRIATPCA